MKNLIISIIDYSLMKENIPSLDETRKCLSGMNADYVDLKLSDFKTNESVFEKLSNLQCTMKYDFVLLYYFGKGITYHDERAFKFKDDEFPIELNRVINLLGNDHTSVAIMMVCGFAQWTSSSKSNKKEIWVDDPPWENGTIISRLVRTEETPIKFTPTYTNHNNYSIGLLADLKCGIGADVKLSENFIKILKNRNFSSFNDFWLQYGYSLKEFNRIHPSTWNPGVCNKKFMGLFR